MALKANLVNADLGKSKITPKELTEFIFHRYLRMQEPEHAGEAAGLFRKYYEEYQECGFRILDRFELEYDREQLERHRQKIDR